MPMVIEAMLVLAMQTGQATALRPAESPGAWVTGDDYPASAVRAGQGGTVGFTLQVDSEGKVRGCMINQSSGVPLLDSTTCDLMTRRARFIAARDARGAPIAATYTARFRWELPTSTDIPEEALAGAARRLRPLTPPHSWFRDEDYPEVAAFIGATGTTRFQLDVDGSGRVTGCHIFETSGYWALDDAICKKMSMRSAFEPALDASGAPVASHYSSVARFVSGGETANEPDGPKVPSATLVVPVAALPAGAGDTALLRVHFTRYGKLDACRAERSSGNRALDSRACAQTLQAVDRPFVRKRGNVPEWNTRMVEVRFTAGVK